MLRNDQEILLEEKMRPGELMPIEEDEHGTYIMNSKDLRAIEHVHRLVEMGIDSLKIEGRTKSPYYVARTCQSYRQAIDDAVAGRPLDPKLLRELDGLANRGYTDGFCSATTTPNIRITCAAIPNRTAACTSAMPYASTRRVA
jgi:putative protease